MNNTLHNSFVSVYQYPSENQNPGCFDICVRVVSVYQYPSENQNRKHEVCKAIRYQFINIHQRTKTISSRSASLFSISLSISIREPKRNPQRFQKFPVSVYQYPSENQNTKPCTKKKLPVSVYQYPSENQNMLPQKLCQLLYQFINIHQRTKTAISCGTLRFWCVFYLFIIIQANRACQGNFRPSPFRPPKAAFACIAFPLQS